MTQQAAAALRFARVDVVQGSTRVLPGVSWDVGDAETLSACFGLALALERHSGRWTCRAC